MTDPHLSEDWNAAIGFLLAFGRDRSDDGILTALAELAAERGKSMPPRDEMIRLIHAARARWSAPDAA